MISELVTRAQRGISHPNTDLDAQTFLLRVRQLRARAGVGADFPVAYQPQVSAGELEDPQVLVWDIGRVHDPARGNFDHHQDHTLGATPIILLQALGVDPSLLDQYVDLGDRGWFFKHPQPLPFVETLQGMAAGINLFYRDDQIRSIHYQDLLAWIEASGTDPYGRFTEDELPERFHPFVIARRAEEAVAQGEAEHARWIRTRIGKIAYVQSDMIGTMRALYDLGAALVILHEPRARMSGWRRPAAKYTVGANPALVAIPDQLDLRPLFARLSALEPTGCAWGGQAGVGGSPREECGSFLSGEQVIKEVKHYLG